MQIKTPSGLMQVTIPDGVKEGETFQFHVPGVAPVAPVAPVPAAAAVPMVPAVVVGASAPMAPAVVVANGVAMGSGPLVGGMLPQSAWDHDLCGCFDHKACQKSCCQCFWTHCCCMPCILPTLHQVANVAGVDTGGGAPCVCLSLCGLPDALLSFIPFIGLIGPAQLFRCTAMQKLRTGTVQKYNITEDACCTCCVSFCWCACLPQCGELSTTRTDLVRHSAHHTNTRAIQDGCVPLVSCGGSLQACASRPTRS
jgi:hypothetical protein